MNVFADYSKYYDLLYQDKDYHQEANFVDALLRQYAKQPLKTLLELGSGTGKHACHLAKKGYEIVGVDQSQTMLEMAGRLLNEEKDTADKIQLFHGDVRNFSIGKHFDAAISLFHVLSYQTSNQDVEAMFKTVKRHVKPGGLFIFDCWYGPAVLNQKPLVRHKRLENNILTVERIAVPTLDVNANTVNVHYHLFIQEQKNAYFQKMEEQHLMRYFFLPEIAQLCNTFEMTILSTSEWLTNRPLNEDTWGACFVVRV